MLAKKSMEFAPVYRQFIRSLRTKSNPNPSLKFINAGPGQDVAKPRIPEVFPNILILPIAKKPLFPNSIKSFDVKDKGVCDAIKKLVSTGQPYLGAFLTKHEDNESDFISELSEIYRIGVFGQILRVEDNSNGGITTTILPHRRIRIKELINFTRVKDDSKEATVEEAAKKDIDGVPKPSKDVLGTLKDFQVSVARVENLYDEPTTKKNPVIKALTSEILAVMKDLIRYNPAVKDQITAFSYSSGISLVDEPSILADFAASIVPHGDQKEVQAILESLVIEERLQKSLILMKKELINSKLQNQINKDVEDKMAKARKEYYLVEHMKGIQKELGLESDGRDKIIEKFKEKAKSLKMTPAAIKVFDEEIARFQTIDPAAMEFSVTRNYLDWITSLPWGKRTQDSFDLQKARSILDEEHYGMKTVKDRILEFIAVGKLKGTLQGKILCLSGPPGVGKTSIGKSIATALNREFYRFSVGGLSDVSEIKGHRRTYVGAMPGKLLQAMKKIQSENPLILIDEIDKLGRNGFRGDPASALLEVLDPEQNSSFLDHYMDIPVDLSQTLFVCTANVLDTIPGPLLDRMEVVDLSGYVTKEKLEIARRYLIPKATESSGLQSYNVTIPDETIEELIDGYCRESGVRNLKNHIEKIFRKVALKLIKFPPASKDDKIAIKPKELSDYVGNPHFSKQRTFDTPQAGVICGLAYNAYGGSTLYIESIRENPKDDHGKGRFQQTGNMGNVMKESTQIAYSYAKHFASRLSGDGDGKSDYFKDSSIHLHVPEGAIPKDGPSAGIAMCSSLVSLALDKPPVMDVAMTGELTLTGRVLKIGGLKEKIMAARRSNIPNVVIPEDNRADFEILEDYIKDGLNVHFVKTFDDVFQVVFGGVTEK